MPAQIDTNVLIEQGSVFRRVYTFVGLDLTGATARMQVRTAPGSTVLLNLGMPPVSGSGIEIDVSETENGQVISTVTVTAEQDLTTALTPGAVVFDIKVTDASDEDDRVIEGNARVTAQVTV